MVYIATGNYSRRVSYSAWDDGIHSDRKLFEKGFLFGVGGVVYIATGNYSRRVSYTAWDDGIHSDRKLFTKGFLYGMRRMLSIVTGNFPFLCYNIRRY